jgi:hypothetical protein
MSLRFLLLITVPLLPITVHAGELPKEGSANFTHTWVVTSSTTPIKVGDRTFGTYEISGVHRNDDGDVMTDMGMRCLGTYYVAGTAFLEGHAACTYTDKDGDQIMTTAEEKKEGSGTENPVAGTGKFAGISGTGDFTTLQFPVKADDKFPRGIVKAHWNWKIQ